MKPTVCSNLDCNNAIPEDPPHIRIGDYTLAPCEIGKIWIGDGSGEGGLFDESKLEEVIKEFYLKNF